jgi:TolB protein
MLAITRVFTWLLVFMSCSIVFSQDSSIGIFSNHGDVGAVENAGSANYNAQDQSYEIAGSGNNMWFAEDQFQFVWKKMSGDFVLRTRAKLLGEGVAPHRKLGWMIRSTLDTDSPYVDIAVHGDGLTSMQYRRTKGADTEQVQSSVQAPEIIQLTRHAGRYTMSVAKFGDAFSSEQLDGIDLGDDVYVGLFVCAHNAAVIERGAFSNVRVVVPAADDFRPYRDYIGSHLETMNVETGHRRIVHSVEDSLQAPNWTVDNQSLIFNRNGLLYSFELSSLSVEPISTDFATRNNNDHVLSFDGSMLAISHHAREDRGRSNVYTVPVEGGTPNRITQQGPSYLHGWSPDGKYLLYTAERDGDYDIYRIPSAGGKEERLTTTAGLDDGSEYAPDGKTIYFNSARSGTMQIWRMNADGSSPEQVTDDEYNNWFPHISPDGKSLVMLSFDKSVDPTDHPFYKHVYLRRMPTEGGRPTVIAYVYGGQGTINVPSWSPDNRQIAFVSNTSDVTRPATEGR